MTERPILFSAPMVRALLAGTKTQTRRVIKAPGVFVSSGAVDGFGVVSMYDGAIREVRCPYGQPGDRLWVRETWQGPLIPESEYTGPHERAKFNLPKFCQYAADGGPAPEFIDDDDNRHCRWRPSIHMPRWASRILLEVIAVRVERLQDISEADALAEGIESYALNGKAGITGELNLPAGYFRYLWESINGPDSWDLNPWVWVVEFRRLQVEAA